MLVLNSDDVRHALPMSAAVDAMKRAFAAYSAGRAAVPPRIHLGIPQNAGVSLVMPSFVWGEDDRAVAEQALAVKVVSLFDGNRARGLARIQAAVVAFDPATGRPEALLEGATLTAIRTAAASGAATDLLARPDVRTVAVFGAGVQARTHIDAMCAVRPVTSVRVFSRSLEKVESLIAEFRARPGWNVDLVAARSPQEAIRGSDVVCAASTAPQPVFDDADVADGTHINAVGSYTPDKREIPAATVRRSFVVVDSRHAAWEEAGDLIQPLQDGLIDRDHVRAELGEIVLGTRLGRTDARQITFFKSVGLAVQDALAAQVALANARERGLGTSVAW